MEPHRGATTKIWPLHRCLEAMSFVSCHFLLHHHLLQWVKCNKGRPVNINSMDRVGVRCSILLAMLVVHLVPIILKHILLKVVMHPRHIISMLPLSIVWLSLLVLHLLFKVGVINSCPLLDQFNHQWDLKEDLLQWLPTVSQWMK
jgi:hypothetical protein